MPGSNGNGLRPEEEIAQNVGSPGGQGNTKSALGWAGLGLGIVDTVANMYMTDRQNRLNREENERNYERNVEFWQMQNDYNHPAAQMQRLREAGLNPNLVYGTPDIAGNNANAPESSKTHYERPNDIDMLGIAMNAQQFAKQDELMSLEIERAELENEKIRIANELEAKNLGIFDEKFNLFKKDLDEKWKNLDTQNILNLSKSQLNESEKKLTDLQYDFEKQSFSDRLEIIAKEKDIKGQELVNLRKVAKKLDAEYSNLLALTSKYYQEVKTLKSLEDFNRWKIQEGKEMLPYNKMLAEAKANADNARAELDKVKKNVENEILKLKQQESSTYGLRMTGTAIKSFFDIITNMLFAVGEIVPF